MFEYMWVYGDEIITTYAYLKILLYNENNKNVCCWKSSWGLLKYVPAQHLNLACIQYELWNVFADVCTVSCKLYHEYNITHHGPMSGFLNCVRKIPICAVTQTSAESIASMTNMHITVNEKNLHDRSLSFLITKYEIVCAPYHVICVYIWHWYEWHLLICLFMIMYY